MLLHKLLTEAPEGEIVYSLIVVLLDEFKDLESNLSRFDSIGGHQWYAV